MRIKEEKVQVMCKKEISGKHYVKGEMHNATLEINDDCTLIWINQKTPGYGDGYFGGRFAVEGNIYIEGKPYWQNYRKYFYDIKTWERIQKLNKLKNIQINYEEIS